MRRAAALLVLLGASLPSPAAAQPDRQAVLVLVAPGMPYERAVGEDALRSVAAEGGIGLMTTRAESQAGAVHTVLAGTSEGEGSEVMEVVEGAGRTAEVLEAGARPTGAADLVVAEASPGSAGTTVRRLLGATEAEEVLVVVASPWPSAAMRTRGDAVTPLVLGRGSPPELAAPGGTVAGLTSPTTRWDGVVANVDVAPTLLAFLDVPVPPSVTGTPIEAAGAAPGRLHERYLGLRSLRVPLQLVLLALALAVLVAGVLFLALRPEAPSVAGALGIWALTAAALPAALVPVGVLPRVSWATVLPLLLVLTAVIVAAARVGGRHDPTAAVAVVAGIALSLLVLDAAQGWRALLMPVVGGAGLDGARFAGLGNPYAGVLLAGAVLVAAHLRPWPGVALLAAAALFAGLPRLGENLGASVTLFAAAGLWIALRVRRRLGLLEVGVAAGAAMVGGAVVALAHAALGPEASHIARAADEAGRGGAGALLEIVARRLALNAELTSRVPPAWLVIAALALLAALAWRRWGYLARDPAWRDACLVLVLSALVGFAVNDTGIGLAGLALVYAAVAVAYPALEGP